MSTAEDSGATANATNSSYGGGGAGGKFRKKPLRRQAKPYDRPPTTLRVNNTNTNNSSSWLKKLVIEPASKLISYGAGRFFGSVFRRSLPPLPLPAAEPPDISAQECDRDQGAALNISQGGEQDPGSGQCSQQINTSRSSGFAELEHLLNQKTFTRSEVAHLTQLLQSQAVEKSPEDANQINVVPALDTARQKELTSCVTEGNTNDGIRTSIGVFTPIHNSKVLENDIASPAELARAYMGSKTSQISPSRLGMQNQFGKESTGLLPNTLIATKSPTMTLAKKTSVSVGAAENGFVTPRSRGRSAIYNMARTPYSRVHSTSIMKGSGINGSGYAGPSASSSSFSPMYNDENFNSRLVTLKRRSAVLNDEVGSVGPMRRIRQKPNLLTPRFHHTSYEVGIGSHAKQKPQLNAEEKNVLKKSGENDNESVPTTSYGYVPSKSREVAAKILQQLEKLSPNEKSSDSKIAAVQEKSPSKLISSRLPGPALRRMEDVDYSSQKQDKAEQNEANASSNPSSRQNPVLNNDSAVSLKSSTPGIIAADSVVKNGTSQPQKKRAFRMSAEEDSLERDNVECNGLASKALPGNNGPYYSPYTKTTIQSGDKSFSGPTSRSTSEPSPGAILFGKGTNVIATSTSEGTRATSESQVFASLVPVSERPKEANTPSFFNFSSKSADKVPSLPSESIRRAEIEPKSSTSLTNISTSIGSEVRTPQSDAVFDLKPVKAVDTNGKCDGVSSAALSIPLVSNCSSVSFTSSSFSDMNRVSTGSAPLFTTSTSITSFVNTGSSSTTAPSSGSIFGFAAKSSSSVGPFSLSGSPVDLSSGVSAAPTISLSDRAAKIDTNPSSGSSSSSYSTVVAPAAASSGNGIFKLASSFTNPTGNSMQGSLFASATKSQMSGVGTISQGSTIESVSTASIPALNMTSSSSLGSLPTPRINFGFSSTSSSGTTSLVPAGGPTPSLFKFSSTPTAISEGSAVTPIFGSGGASVSSSSATNTFASSSSPAASIFGFGGPSVSAFSSGTSGVFGFGGSSSASFSTANAVSSSTAPSNGFGSGWQNPRPPIFGSTPTSAPASPSTGFSFTASMKAAASMASNSPFSATSAPSFSFTSAKDVSSPALPNTQPIFGNQSIGGGFAASPANSNQMNAEDSMAEDPVPSSASVPLFGQTSLSPSPPAFAFGSTAPSQNNPFMLNGQQSLAPPQNPSPFQASASQEFNPGGSFSLGSGGVDKSGRRIVKINRNKNRKK